MKHKIFAMILALTVIPWAQTAIQTPAGPQASPAPAEKAKTSCCDKMSGMKDGASCARHGKKSANAKAGSCCAAKDSSCCSGKEGMSCMKDQNAAASRCKGNCMKDKTASSCCGGQGCEKNCCSKNSDKTARNCCSDRLRG
jgi:hypothetical protein